MTSVAEEELEELQQRYFDLLVTAAHTGDTTAVEKMNVRMKALESRVKLHRALTDPELEGLINEVETSGGTRRRTRRCTPRRSATS